MPESLISVESNAVSGRPPIFGRLLVLVAHPDDESIGCGILLQGVYEATIIFATDGAPHDQRFWHGLASREEYARVRREEAGAAAAIIGLNHIEFLDFPDQQLYRNLSHALAQCISVVSRGRFDAIVTHAYEGGHPDHDACAFLASRLAQRFGMSVWEMPLYHFATGDHTLQRFISVNNSFPHVDEEMVLAATPEELQRKGAMISAHRSQQNALKGFDIGREVFRRQPVYDFRRPPHAGKLNYEEWQWLMTGHEVSAAFSFLLSERANA